MRLSLGRRILAITAAALLPIIAVVAYNEQSLRRNRDSEVHQLALATARQASLELERVVSGTEGILQSIVTAPAVAAFNSDLCDAYLQRLRAKLPHFTGIAVFDMSGAVRCRSDRTVSDVNFADRPYFREALNAAGEMIVSEYTVSRGTGERTLPLAMAMLDNQGKPAGVVAAGLDLDWLGGTLREHQLSGDGSLTIADRNGTVIAREPFPERFVGTVIPEAFQPLVQANRPGSREVTSQDGTTRVLGYIPVSAPPKGLYVSAGISRDEAFRAVNTATVRSLIVAIVAVALAVFLSWLLGRRLVKGPVQRISRTLAARRNGETGIRTGMDPADGELEALGAEFDAYMDEIEKARAERERAERHRELLAQELSHRLKNMIATIQAVAGQTFSRDAANAPRLKAFKSRLAGIANAQQMLLFGQSDKATLRDALMSSIVLFESAPGERFSLSGPELRITGQTALRIAMAAHELCTNAVKYGALSTQEGRVEVNWEVVGVRRETVRLEWLERGGPPPKPPENAGFGHTMIKRLFGAEMNGTVEMEFGSQGLRCVVEVPLASIGEAPHAGEVAAE